MTSSSTQPPTFSNVSTASSLTLLTLPLLHPLLPPTASITSSRWFLLRAHAAGSNSTSTVTYLTHFTTKSSPMLPTSTFSQAYFLLRHPTLSSDYVAATHTTPSSTGNLTQASNVNYIFLYTRLPTNQLVHVAPWLIFLVATSSNVHASTKLEFTIQFTTALHKLLPQLTLSPHTLVGKSVWNSAEFRN